MYGQQRADRFAETLFETIRGAVPHRPIVPRNTSGRLSLLEEITMSQTIDSEEAGREWPTGLVKERRRGRCRKAVQGTAFFAAVAAMPGRAFAQIADPAPTNAGLPGGALIAQVIGWGKWVGLSVCVLAIIFGGATWRGMGGNSGRGVEGKAYVGAGMLGAMVIGLAVVAVNTLYGAGNAGG